MEKLKKRIVISYSITSALALAMAIAYMASNHVFSASKVQKFRILSDAFTIPGLLIIGFGALVWVSSLGFFDGTGYLFGKMFSALIPGARAIKEQSYYDYVEMKRERRREKMATFGFFFVVGGICLALGILFLVIFYQVR